MARGLQPTPERPSAFRSWEAIQAEDEALRQRYLQAALQQTAQGQSREAAGMAEHQRYMAGKEAERQQWQQTHNSSGGLIKSGGGSVADQILALQQTQISAKTPQERAAAEYARAALVSKSYGDMFSSGDFRSAWKVKNLDIGSPDADPRKHTGNEVFKPNGENVDVYSPSGEKLGTMTGPHKIERDGYGGISQAAQVRMKNVAGELMNMMAVKDPNGGMGVPQDKQAMYGEALAHAQKLLHLNSGNDTQANPMTDGEAALLGLKTAKISALQKLEAQKNEADKRGDSKGAAEITAAMREYAGISLGSGSVVMANGDVRDTLAGLDPNSRRVASARPSSNVMAMFGNGQTRAFLDSFAAAEGKQLQTQEDYRAAAAAVAKRAPDSPFGQFMQANNYELSDGMARALFDTPQTPQPGPSRTMMYVPGMEGTQRTPAVNGLIDNNSRDGAPTGPVSFSQLPRASNGGGRAVVQGLGNGDSPAMQRLQTNANRPATTPVVLDFTAPEAPRGLVAPNQVPQDDRSGAYGVGASVRNGLSQASGFMEQFDPIYGAGLFLRDEVIFPGVDDLGRAASAVGDFGRGLFNMADGS